MAKNGFKINMLAALSMGTMCLNALIQPEKSQKKLEMSPQRQVDTVNQIFA
jgi:hypothetical protein